MGKFNRDNKRPGGGGFGRGFSARGGSSFGGGSRFGGGRPALHKATCSECGASCDLPFKPTGDRPVYCNDCFRQQDNGRPEKFGGNRYEKPRFDDKQKYDAVCDKCGHDCQVPFRPSAGKPVYCNNCFDKGGSRNSDRKDSGEVMEQIKQLNNKVDKLIKLLTPNALTEKVEEPETAKEEKVEKAAKEKVKKIKTIATSKKAPAKKKK